MTLYDAAPLKPEDNEGRSGIAEDATGWLWYLISPPGIAAYWQREDGISCLWADKVTLEDRP